MKGHPCRHILGLRSQQGAILTVTQCLLLFYRTYYTLKRTWKILTNSDFLFLGNGSSS